MSITLPQRIECLKENRQYNKSWLSRMRIRQVNLITVISFLTSNVEFLVVLFFCLFFFKLSIEKTVEIKIKRRLPNRLKYEF